MELRLLCVDSGATIEAAMKKLDESARKILFVLDGERLVATLTDGDVRRHLLSGGTLNDNVMVAANQNPRSATSIAQARNILNNTRFQAIPLTDKAGRLISVVMDDQVIYDESLQMHTPVVIQAGGKGTRLEPFTKVLPKPLIPVGDLPILEHIMKEFEQYGCEDFHLIVNHKKQLIKAYFAESSRNERTKFYDEDKPLGTGGGLSMLKGKITETFFLTNCDILIRTDYQELLRFHKENKNAVTMVCAHKKVTIPYGVVEVGEDNVIKEMREKPSFSFLTNTGFYVVEPEVLEDIEDDVAIGFPDIITRQQQKGRKTAVFSVAEEDWMDMGQLEELEEMRQRLEQNT